MVSMATSILLCCFFSSGASLCVKDVAQSAPVGCSTNNYYMCVVESEDSITIPCGNVQIGTGAYFNYSMVLGSNIRTPETFYNRLEFLSLNVTPRHHGALVYCSTNVSTFSSCYEIHVHYAPQITQGAGTHKGRRNDRYCLSCQVEANPAPKCTWAIKLYHFLNGATDVFPEGVHYPFDPELDCLDAVYPLSLPQPVYQGSGCVLKIDSLTLEFQHYYLRCTANNSVGSIYKDYGPIDIQVCGGDSSEMVLTPSEVVVVTVGDRFTISCSVSNAYPSSSLVWYHNNSAIPYASYRNTTIYHERSCVYETQLVFGSISYSDGGNYTCHFYYGLRFTIDKHVCVNVVPKVLPCGSKKVHLTLSPNAREADVTVGATLNVTCTAHNAANASDIVWLHNGTVLEEGTVIESNFKADSCTRESTLAIVARNISDGGNYSCFFQSTTDAIVKSLFTSILLIPRPDDPYINISDVIGGAVAGGVAVIIILVIVLLSLALALNSRKFHYFIKWKLKEPAYVYKSNDKMEQFKFDVFLSFANEDEDKVDVMIRQELKKRNYSVCWHHEEFIAGKFVTENIEECISGCRKSIIILSDNFFKSQYCRYELSFSMNKLKKTSTCCVVPVLMTGCESEQIPQEVLALTYLKLQEQRFIDKLCHILGKPIKEHEGTI